MATKEEILTSVKFINWETDKFYSDDYYYERELKVGDYTIRQTGTDAGCVCCDIYFYKKEKLLTYKEIDEEADKAIQVFIESIYSDEEFSEFLTIFSDKIINDRKAQEEYQRTHKFPKTITLSDEELDLIRKLCVVEAGNTKTKFEKLDAIIQKINKVLAKGKL